MKIPSRVSSSQRAALIRKANEISSIGYSMAVPPGLGYLADRYFGSAPIGLIIGAVLGFLTGTLQLFKLAGMISSRPETKTKKNQSDSSTKL
ncbi:MAG: AtpZ/AtpI family protein [Planctomycetaceae bacterium]|nr:AtpZ/AtpI family protein [Planctomycetaceae bacterium]